MEFVVRIVRVVVLWLWQLRNGIEGGINRRLEVHRVEECAGEIHCDHCAFESDAEIRRSEVEKCEDELDGKTCDVNEEVGFGFKEECPIVCCVVCVCCFPLVEPAVTAQVRFQEFVSDESL